MLPHYSPPQKLFLLNEANRNVYIVNMATFDNTRLGYALERRVQLLQQQLQNAKRR